MIKVEDQYYNVDAYKEIFSSIRRVYADEKGEAVVVTYKEFYLSTPIEDTVNCIRDILCLGSNYEKDMEKIDSVTTFDEETASYKIDEEKLVKFFLLAEQIANEIV